MNIRTHKIQEDKSSLIENAVSKKREAPQSTFQFMDQRPEAVAQKKLQQMADNSQQIKQSAQLRLMTGNHPVPEQNPIQKKENKTGLPDNLKSGIENLSGYSMNDVKVHYNSYRPAQLRAHAYAQGTDIHIAPGQEKHLAHEAWHVVQQKQGRVRPTMQMKGRIAMNDHAGLEREADVMGMKAARLHSNGERKQLLVQKSSSSRPVVQGMYWWAPYAAVGGVLGLIGLYAWWNSGKKQPPPNLTDVKFDEKYAKDDMKEAFDGIPPEELKLLEIQASGDRITSPHHPDLLASIGSPVKRLKGAESSDELMSKEGIKYDRQEADRLVKAAQVKKGEGIHKARKNSAVIGEYHDSTKDKADLVRLLADKHSDQKRTLYIEIIKEMQPLIDHWQEQLTKDDSAEMPVSLARYIKKLDDMMDKYDVSGDSDRIEIEKDPLGTYSNIIRAAAKAGIRIVGMDSLHAKNMEARGKDPDSYKRAAAMNQSAFEIIKEDQEKNPSEYLVYTGHAHVDKQRYKDHPDLLGLTDRLGVPDYRKKTK